MIIANLSHPLSKLSKQKTPTVFITKQMMPKALIAKPIRVMSDFTNVKTREQVYHLMRDETLAYNFAIDSVMLLSFVSI